MTLSNIAFAKTKAFQILSQDRQRLESTTIKQLFQEDAKRQSKFSILDQDILLYFSVTASLIFAATDNLP